MEVQLLPINREKLKELVSYSFEGDNDLLDTYHISPGTLEHCVDNTFTFIDKNKDFYGSDMCWAAVVIPQGVIGYTVYITNEKSPNELYSFGIRKEYRTEEILHGWLKAVENELHLPYFIVLWDKNIRAIEFFRKNGFIIEERNGLKRLTSGAPEWDNKALIIKSD